MIWALHRPSARSSSSSSSSSSSPPPPRRGVAAAATAASSRPTPPLRRLGRSRRGCRRRLLLAGGRRQLPLELLLLLLRPLLWRLRRGRRCRSLQHLRGVAATAAVHGLLRARGGVVGLPLLLEHAEALLVLLAARVEAARVELRRQHHHQKVHALQHHLCPAAAVQSVSWSS